MLEGFKVQHAVGFLAVRSLGLLIESLRCLIAQQARLNHLLGEILARPNQMFPKFIMGNSLVEVGRYVLVHIHTNEVQQAKGCGFRVTDQRTGDSIHLLYRVIVFQHIVQGGPPGEHSHPVCDEVGGVLTEYHGFSQPSLPESLHKLNNCRICFGCGDEFEQLEVARGVEEMGPEEMGLEPLRATLGDLVNGYAGGVR